MSDNIKQNKPNVPNLRFTGFEGEWDKCKIKDVCSITTGNKNTQDKDDSGLYPFYVRSPKIEHINTWTFDGEAILTAGDGVGVGKVFHYSTGKIGVHQRVYLLSDFKCNGKYLYYYFSSRFYDRVKRMSAKNSVDSVRMEMIADMPLTLPTLHEQIKIGSLLSLLDERISIQNKVIEDLISLEKVFINSSFRDIKGENIPLSVISQRIVDRNANCGCSNVLTISAKDGLVSQLNYFKKSVASQNLSNYYLLQKGDFAYNKSYSTDYPWGAVKHLENYNQGILSPLYFCFRANSRVVNIDYLQLFFDTDIWYKHISEIAVEGARNHGLLNMSVSDFMAMPILLPSLVEQNKIVNNLMYFRKKKQSEIQYLMALEKQKKYLLSQMFI